MTETKTTYTAGPVTFVSDPTPQELLSEHFTFNDTGLTVTGAPTQQHFDLCILHLATRLDRLRWQVAAWANEYRRRFGVTAYEKAVALAGLSVKPETVERWAYIERNVPPCNRVPELSLWYHDAAAKLSPEAQPEAFTACLEQNMTCSEFYAYCAKLVARGAPVTPVAYPDDRKFELTQELYNLEVKYQEQGHALKSARVETSQLAAAVTDTEARLRALAWDVVGIVAGRG